MEHRSDLERVESHTDVELHTRLVALLLIGNPIIELLALIFKIAIDLHLYVTLGPGGQSELAMAIWVADFSCLQSKN